MAGFISSKAEKESPIVGDPHHCYFRGQFTRFAPACSAAKGGSLIVMVLGPLSIMLRDICQRDELRRLPL